MAEFVRTKHVKWKKNGFFHIFDQKKMPLWIEHVTFFNEESLEITKTVPLNTVSRTIQPMTIQSWESNYGGYRDQCLILSFLNLETNLILYLYPKKCIKYNQSESRIRSRKIWNFARHLRLIYRNGRDSLVLKTRFLIFLYYIQKRVD